MIFKACAEMGISPSRVVKVDDAEVGIEEGRAAGAFTVGVASGNTLGLSLADFQALSLSEREKRVGIARQALLGAGADLVIDSVAELVVALERSIDGNGPGHLPAHP
jgi:phosphonoacetaldehyde hydrolase